jgi:hypothetical protein
VSEYNRLSAVGFGADGLGLLANQDAFNPQICTVRRTFSQPLAEPDLEGLRQHVQLSKGGAWRR